MTTYANERMGQMLGLTGGEMLGRSMYEFMDERAHSIAAANLEKRNRGIAEQHEFLFQSTDGRDVWTLLATNPLKNEHGVVVEVLGMVTEITERKRAEEDLREKLAIIERQRTELQALSSPVIEVWDGVLCVPVVSTVDAVRADGIMKNLLEAITRSRAKFAIIDLTGAESIDAAAANHFLKIVAAARLIGAESIITGLRPAAAQAIVSLGVNLAGITTLPNIKEGLRWCTRGARPAAAAAPWPRASS